MTEDLHKTVFVPFLPQEAFHLFVSAIGEWWPLSKDTLSGDQPDQRGISLVIEPHAGGHMFELMKDGSHKNWADVMRYKPGEDLLLCWRKGRPVAQMTEVEVVFTPAGSSTKIDLCHRCFKRFGDEADALQKHYDLAWTKILEGFISYCATHQAA